MDFSLGDPMEIPGYISEGFPQWITSPWGFLLESPTLGPCPTGVTWWKPLAAGGASLLEAEAMTSMLAARFLVCTDYIIYPEYIRQYVWWNWMAKSGLKLLIANFVWTEHDVSLLKQTRRVFGTIPPGHLMEATWQIVPHFGILFTHVYPGLPKCLLIPDIGLCWLGRSCNFQTWIRLYVVGWQCQKFCMNPDIAQSPSLECFLFEDSRWYQLSRAGAEIFIFSRFVTHPLKITVE